MASGKRNKRQFHVEGLERRLTLSSTSHGHVVDTRGVFIDLQFETTPGLGAGGSFTFIQKNGNGPNSGVVQTGSFPVGNT